MKNRPFLALATLLLATLAGCSLQEKYAKNNAAAASWLASTKTAPATTNFEGVYYSPDWGQAVLNQSNGELTGAIGHFNIKGSVSGRTASLALIDDQWVEYTMVLTKRDGEFLTGSFSPCIPFCAKGSNPAKFVRIGN
jgi:hypothetical protein